MPMEDPTITNGEGVVEWITGFYDHSLPPSFPSTPLVNPRLELSHTTLTNPPPTIATMHPEEIQTVFYAPPALPEGSDSLLYSCGQRLGLFQELRNKALYLMTNGDVTAEKKRWSESVEFRVIWCDHTVWGIPWGIPKLYREVEDAKAKGELRVGQVNIVRMRGANHYVRTFNYQVDTGAHVSDAKNNGVLDRFIGRNLSEPCVLCWPRMALERRESPIIL